MERSCARPRSVTDMAADQSPDWVSSLPWAWGYGITGGGRVFFINEEAKSTTWLHPVTGETVLTGHRRSPDLPTGWEEAYTFEGARYYINHNERKVTCKHPVTGQPSQDNCIFVVNDQASSTMTSQETKDRTLSVTSDNSNCNPDPPANPTSPLTRSSRSSGKLHNFGKRSNSIKRNPNAPVTMRGWLYKKANSGMKLWKKRWFVLSDLCLFYYRDEKEEGVLGSILLPSFQISVVSPEDHINRTHAFKASHSNMRTYYFCTDTSKEMELWMKVMIGASLVHSEPIKRTNVTKVEDSAPEENNHVGNHRLLIRPENNNTLRNKDMLRKVEEKAAREAEKYGFQKDGQERPLTKINSVKHQSYIYDYDVQSAHYRSIHVNGPDNRTQDSQRHTSETDSRVPQRTFPPHEEPDRVIQRTNSMLQLEQWIRSQREKGPDDDSNVVMSYQTLPRNMPSYRAQIVPRYPEGYKTLPRNLKTRPESICSTTGMVPAPTTTEEKRRSIRDDTMWQLYEWQQRQFYNKQTTLRRHSSLTSPKTMVHISDQALHSIPLSPSHGSISGYHTYSPHRAYRSELSSPVQRGDLTIDRRQKAPSSKLGFAPDRRSAPVGLPVQPLTQQGLQGKTMSQEDCRPTAYKHRTEEVDVDAKLSSLCEQDKLVQALEQKLQQLHKEKYTLEQALLAASQEIEMNADNPAAIQSVILQRDELQSGLLSTCREVSRASTELERSWREYDKLERDVTAARNQMREHLERLGEVQTESAGIQRAQMQKEIWRIQDVMEGLSKHKQQRTSTETGNSDTNLFSSVKNSGEGPDYRLYKSEPELTTVAEVDESNGEDKTDLTLDIEATANKGSHFPVGIIPPRTKSPPLESTTIASYVTLRKTKKPDTRSERPRSAVEHLCIAESPRPRMSLSEQLERMRRHQAACLKEKKKGFSIPVFSDQSPSQSSSLSREDSVQQTQLRKKEEKLLDNVKDTENAVQKGNTETPSPETITLKDVPGGEESPVVTDKEVAGMDETSVIRSVEPGDEDAFVNSPAPVAKDVATQDRDPQSSDTDRVPDPHGNCLPVVTSVPKHKSDSGHNDEKTREAERSGILFSYDFSADTLRRQTALEAGNRPPLQEPPTLPAPTAPTQLTEGSHFMCV